MTYRITRLRFTAVLSLLCLPVTAQQLPYTASIPDVGTLKGDGQGGVCILPYAASTTLVHYTPSGDRTTLITNREIPPGLSISPPRGPYGYDPNANHGCLGRTIYFG